MIWIKVITLECIYAYSDETDVDTNKPFHKCKYLNIIFMYAYNICTIYVLTL